MIRKLLPFLALALVGCNSAPTVNVVAIDASGSAQEFRDPFVRVTRDLNESTPGDGAIELYRFDTAVHELYVGGMMGDREFRDKMNVALEDRGRKGTDLLPLVQRIDERVPRYAGKPVHVTVCTDCGVEMMGKAQHEKVQEIVSRWAKEYPTLQVSFVGVRALHHDVLRTDFKALGDRLSIR